MDGGGACVNGGGVHVDDDVVCDHFGLELNLRTCKLPPADALTNDCFLMVFCLFFLVPICHRRQATEQLCSISCGGSKAKSRSFFFLLKACFGTCRVNHLLRALAVGHGWSLAEQTSALFRATFDSIFGDSCFDLRWVLACMLRPKGGDVLDSLAPHSLLQ